MKKKLPEFALDVNAVLDRLLEAREIPTGWGRDTALAKELGILPKRVNAWRERNTIDHAIVAFKSREWGLSLSWVFFGDGPQQVLPTPTPPSAIKAMRSLFATFSKQMADIDRRYQNGEIVDELDQASGDDDGSAGAEQKQS